MHVKLVRLICQGCNRYSRAATSIMAAIEKARRDGWECATNHGQPSSATWCRRCSGGIVASAR